MLNHLFNLVGYNPNGREDPSKDSREEGYLFWIAWLQHNGAALFSTSDANGPFRPVTLGGTCSVLQVDHEREPAAEPDAAARPHRPQDLRDQLSMQKHAPSLARIATMVLFALSCFGLLLFLWLSFGGPIPLKPKGYQVKVAFPEATQLGLEADVRVAGVSVGKVRDKTIDPAHPNRTVATIELDRKYAPLAKDARAILRQKTLLGETYVEMTPGNKRAAGTVPDGGFLGDARVAKTVELDEIFQALDPKTRKSFQTWQQDLSKAVAGRGRDLTTRWATCPPSPTTATTC